MDVLKSISELRQWQTSEKPADSRGLVPTMGALHDGHLSLVDLSHSLADRTVVSIFVNPTQFGKGEDFTKYPRDLDKDLELCRQHGADAVFCPTAAEMYPDGANVTVEESQLSGVLCGKSRPGHFSGVLTVVAKLFNLILPQYAVFGEKDAQQLRLIQAMCRDLNFPLEIISGPIVREADGLARSSRNVYLSVDERTQAPGIYASLLECKSNYDAGTIEVSQLESVLRECLVSHGITDIDYAEIRDNRSLAQLERANKPVLVAVAVHIGRTRLIDNIVLG